MIALELDRVSRDFTTPDGSGYRALEDVSLAVADGSFVAIVGPSGCGKSTLLNIGAGLLTASAGTVRVGGEPLTGINRRATYMFQQDALLPWKTVRENVALGLTLGGTSNAEALARADTWLARVDLSAFAAHYPSQLSGGMRKRVVMAQNWILDRSILLMDEPFSALDVHTRQRMEIELLGLWEGSGSSRTLPEQTAPEQITPAWVASGSSRTLPEQDTPASAVSGVSQTLRPEQIAPAPVVSGVSQTLRPEQIAPASAVSGVGQTLRAEQIASASVVSGFSQTLRPGRIAPASVVSGFSQTLRKTVVFVTHDLEEAIALADEVVVLSAGPATHIVARQTVTLNRPRALMELRTTPEFVDLYSSIWAVLREEVIKSQRAVVHG